MSLSLDLEQCLLLFFRRIRYHFAHLHQVGTLSLSDDSFSIANTLGQALSLSLKYAVFSVTRWQAYFSTFGQLDQ